MRSRGLGRVRTRPIDNLIYILNLILEDILCFYIAIGAKNTSVVNSLMCIVLNIGKIKQPTLEVAHLFKSSDLTRHHVALHDLKYSLIYIQPHLCCRKILNYETVYVCETVYETVFSCVITNFYILQVDGQKQQIGPGRSVFFL